MSIPSQDVARILFVCTANECRSPFAEAIATRLAGDLRVAFSSAGLHARNRPVPVIGMEHAAESNLSLEHHRSRRVRADELASYDAVLAMTREHARELLVLDHAIRPRLFTLKQFVTWLETQHRPRRAAIGGWLDAVAADRSLRELVGLQPSDDVDDPMGRPIEEWRHMSAELTVLITRMLRGLYDADGSHRR